MKRTLTVNLNSIVFNIDDDAYEVLNKYLSDIAAHFSSDEEKDEIMADIEARIAELFGDRLQRNKEVITMSDVQEIIAVMGNPSQYADGDETKENATETTKTDTKKQSQKRFYRDPENAILGGVCSGIAAYFNWDATWVRVLVILIALISSGVAIAAYIIAWVIAPKAVTASQRLEMQGEDVTVENIKAEIENVKNYVESEKFQSTTKSFGRRVGEIIGWIIKAFAIFVGTLIAFPLVLVLIVLFFVLIAMLLVAVGLLPAMLFDTVVHVPDNGFLFVLSLIFLIGAPVFTLVYALTRSRSKTKSNTTNAKITYAVSFVLWIAGFFMLVGAIANSKENWEKFTGIHWTADSHSGFGTRFANSGEFIEQVREIPEFKNIDVRGNFVVEFVNSPEQEVMISASRIFMSQVNAEVRNETLYLNHSGSNRVRLRNPVRVRISTDDLQKIRARGGAKVSNDSTLQTENFQLNLSGGSRANMSVEAENGISINASGGSIATINSHNQSIRATAAGGSRITLTGNSNNIVINASGGGNVNADDLKSEQAEVNVSGGGSVRVYASQSIDATASGGGRITVYGNPPKVEQRTSGGGSVIIR